MNIIYENTDITDMVETKKCCVHDTCGKRCDSLEIIFENAAGWYRWGPKEDDTIKVISGAYDSGTMYVNAIIPQDGRFRIIATSLPLKSRQKRFQNFSNKTIDEIMRNCAAQCGMSSAIFGIDRTSIIPYIERDKDGQQEGCASFLNRLLTLEGAKLKCINGKFTAIGLLFAQSQDPVKGLQLTAKQEGTTYSKLRNRVKSFTVISPYAKAKAVDTSMSRGREDTMSLPAKTDVQAGRWARGLLLDYNRESDGISISTAFDQSFTALARVDISGGTDQDGEWIIDDVQHDLIELTSNAILRRCISTIQ